MNSFNSWHKKAPFGMFIHWGVYAMTNYHEQFLMRTKADRSDYEQLYKSFNPTEYDPNAWVKLAKDAGMKYICFTAKHHDGFCMWDTKTTDYNITSTPYGKDVLKMLQLACEKEGLKLCIYYSNPDWYQENAYNEKSTHQIPARESDEPNMDKYKEYLKAQITELLTNYGEISTLFWDIPPHYDDPSINELVRSLQPNILINDRGFDCGDFSTPERFVPEGNVFTKATEACQSVGRQSWSYRTNEDYYSSNFLTQSIAKIMAMGGNYLLNIGPMATGALPFEGSEIIRKVGVWYNKVSEAFSATPTALFHGKDNILTTASENNLYIHFFSGLNCSGIVLDPITILPVSAEILNDGSKPTVSLDVIPTFYQREDGNIPYLHIYNMPCEELSATATVLKLTFSEDVDISSLFEKEIHKGEARL